ncbi:MAG TPA: hypothetical protein VD927_18705 [Chryseosolibacter sp.]|nr:hypothetical protein [Chryseosolibacter sp.]
MNFFKTNPVIGISTFRLYLLRIFYAMAVLMLGIDVWTEIFTHEQSWAPLPGVAFSFWGAFSLLAIIGIAHPLKMLPLLLVQFTYKLIWLLIVAYPLWSASQLAGDPAESLTRANAIGLVLDLLIIPWPYVFKHIVFTKTANV